VYTETPQANNPPKEGEAEVEFVSWTDSWDRYGRPLIGD
jgi:hypothetical protein